MLRSRLVLVLPLVAAGLAACGGGGGTEPPPANAANCSAPAQIQLAAGEHSLFVPTTSNGCFRLPPAGATGAEYIFSLVSGSGQITSTGVTTGYAVRAGPQGTFTSAPAPAPPASPQVAAEPDWPARFHFALRERERELSAMPGNRIAAPRAPAVLTVPTVGEQVTFKVCSNVQCNQFNDVTATAKVVGNRVAVYLDNDVPTSDPLTQADLDDLAQTFDQYHYPIDVNAFGAESDLDASGVVVILLTDAVNALTPDCSNGRILGFFWGGDLLQVTGSNRAEIFYGMVPAPATPTCTAASRQATVDRLKPTMIHEFQHMISFNQHALVRGGQGEVTWLNEALSHFAEELGGRLIPNSECPGFSSCRSQYASGDLLNGYDYMSDTEAHFLISPSGSTGTLEERGAGWLFLRWLADQFGTDEHGTNVTTGLVQTSNQGAANVQAVTGNPFATLVAEWQLALFLDDLPGFTPGSPRLAYTSWGFRAVFELNCCASDKPFPQAFPFTPVNVTSSTPFLRTGTLRGGTGRHFQAVQAANGPALDVLIARTSGGPALDAAAEPRVAIVRLR